MWDSGHGVVIMTNNWAFETEVLMRYVINAVAQEYGWSYRVPTFTRWPYADTVLLASAKLRGAQAAIAEYYELKKGGQSRSTRSGICRLYGRAIRRTIYQHSGTSTG